MGREIGGGGRKDRWPGRQEKKESEKVCVDLPYNIMMPIGMGLKGGFKCIIVIARD